VQRFSSLSPEDREFVVDILDDPEIDDLGDAIRTLRGGFSRSAPQEGRNIERVRNQTEKAFQKLFSLMEDMQSVNANHSCYKASREALEGALEVWRTWR
jgi:hypothetical protein